MITEKDLRTWLMSTPRPAKIIVTDGDGERQQVAGPGDKGGGNNWTRCAKNILTMGPARIDLYDASDVLLRCMKPEEEMALEMAKVDATVGPISHHDPETARLTHFANLLYRATEFSIGTAFTKMVELFEIQSERTIALESRLERAERDYRRVVTDSIEESLDRAQEMQEQVAAAAAAAQANGQNEIPLAFLHSLLAGAQAQQQAAKQQAKPTNGKGSS